MEHRNSQSTFGVTGRIDKKVFNTDDIENAVADFASLSKFEKLLVTRPSAAIDYSELTPEQVTYANVDVEPVDTETIHNVTVTRFHEYFVDNLDPAQTGAKDNVNAAWMALGDDAASGTAETDSDLNNRVYSETVTDHADNGAELLASTFVDSTEANGYTVNEIGLFSGDPANLGNAEVFMLNHATFADVTKDNSKTVTFDVTLTFSDV